MAILGWKNLVGAQSPPDIDHLRGFLPKGFKKFNQVAGLVAQRQRHESFKDFDVTLPQAFVNRVAVIPGFEAVMMVPGRVVIPQGSQVNQPVEVARNRCQRIDLEVVPQLALFRPRGRTVRALRHCS